MANIHSIPKQVQELGICQSRRPRFSSLEAVPYQGDRGDAEGVKDGDVGTGKNQFLNLFGYIQEVPLFHRIYQLCKLIQNTYTTVPKFSRYTTWQRCDATALDLMKDLMRVGHSFGKERVKVLKDMSDSLELLKVLMRLAKDEGAIKKRKYVEFEALLQEIGRMIGGWIKSASPKA